ncbi:MAG TPA: metallophosphoesterase [Longimicrobiales bacterium]
MAKKNYDQQIARGMDKAYLNSPKLAEFNVETDKWVIFSDLHRGKRDGADDFKGCEKAYNAALGYYYEKGYTLIGLGDVDELWECSPKDVIKSYTNTMNLEAQFQANRRYHRFYGNHDADWKRGSLVRRKLHDIYGSQLVVHEAMRVQVKAAGIGIGQIFLVHGHQGTLDADQYSWLARFAVRYGWGFIQRLFNIRSTTPARDFELRHKHNVAMYRWAEQKGDTILIAGHTHRPVFASTNKVALLQDQLRDVRAQISAAAPNPPDELVERAARIRAEIESSRVQEVEYASGEAPIRQARPCYFNTGCCSFSDGDVTAIEIAHGRIKLVRWLDDDGNEVPKELASQDLRTVFMKLGPVATPAPAAPVMAGEIN